MIEFPVPVDLATRATSSFPISIGTALAFETLFDPRYNRYDARRDIPPRVDLHRYNNCYINIDTLVRNICQSVPSQVMLKADKSELFDTLMQEIEVIFSLFAQEGRGIIQPVFYDASYEKINKHTPHSSCKLRVPTSEGQKYVAGMVKYCTDRLRKEWKDLRIYDIDIRPPERTNSLILTHVPHDLISHKNFSRLDLLESHTGKLKQRAEWGSKYQPIGEQRLDHLPFHRKLLWVFGDKHQIMPMALSLRKLIYKIAEDRHWTPFTTLDKVNMDIKLDVREPFVLMVLNTIK